MTAEAHPAWRLFAELCATREEMTIDDPCLGVAVTEAAARADVDVAARADLAERLRADLSARDGLYRAAAHGQSAIPGSGATT